MSHLSPLEFSQEFKTLPSFPGNLTRSADVNLEDLDGSCKYNRGLRHDEMRSLEDTRKRWSLLFANNIGLDLRQALKEPEEFHPCEDGLRSICWKAFLLYGPPSQASWPKKLADSRSAYVSLRDHFLRYIDHPDDLQSSIDPLTDDNNSPWSTLRQDEVNRAEIFQDVERCLQDNYFFREPGTQRMLLDVLFIYSKLNPDVGYRQGMHEILAPILWVVERDAIDQQTPPSGKTSRQEDDEDLALMTEALNSSYVEHDAFSLFCVVMQTAKSFYEMDDSKDTSPIVSRCHRINDEILVSVDPELAEHLQAVEILPQIYLIRWIRLLFEREFEFNDVLLTWDLLFAENLNLGVIDLTCVSMLLRIRWQLIDADYSSALTLLLRYPSLEPPTGPQTLIKDALYLRKHCTRDAAASLVEHHSGRRPTLILEQRLADHPRGKSAQSAGRERRRFISASSNVSSVSPSRPGYQLSHQQKNLENLFQEVSGGLQRRTENWNLSKAVRGAVGEVRRNVSNINSAASSPRRIAAAVRGTMATSEEPVDALDSLTARITTLETRNRLLAKMLGGALESLRTHKTGEKSEDAFNISLAKIQFVQVYLDDPEIPIPPESPESEQKLATAEVYSQGTATRLQDELSKPGKDSPTLEPVKESPELQTTPVGKTTARKDLTLGNEDSKPKQHLSPRPSLAQSSFSWMLGQDRHRSSFVSSVSVAPEEERRGSLDVKPRGSSKHLFKDVKADEGRRGSDTEDDGFTMNNLHAARDAS